MKQKFLTKSTVLALVFCLLALLFASAATYAWFSNNAKTETNSVTAKTSVEEVTLELSTEGGSNFHAEAECALKQVNSADCESLTPVSTVDLKTFVYCPNTAGQYATKFKKVENESYYYHGRIYLRATATGSYEDATVSLYLDEGSDSGGAIVSAAENSNVLTAARLGLTLDEADAKILRLTENSLDEKERLHNTKINGTIQDGDIVLQWNGSEAAAVADPSVLYSQYVLNETTGTTPDAPLFTMQVNKIYALDVYYYLEGCDPDCTEAISYQANDLHLAFYGLIS